MKWISIVGGCLASILGIRCQWWIICCLTHSSLYRTGFVLTVWAILTKPGKYSTTTVASFLHFISIVLFTVYELCVIHLFVFVDLECHCWQLQDNESDDFQGPSSPAPHHSYQVRLEQTCRVQNRQRTQGSGSLELWTLQFLQLSVVFFLSVQHINSLYIIKYVLAGMISLVFSLILFLGSTLTVKHNDEKGMIF